MTVQDRIRLYMTANEITQKELSLKTGIPVSQLSLSLRNKRRLDVCEFEKIIVALEETADVFIHPEELILKPSDREAG